MGAHRNNHFDVIICGGSFVGLLLAKALSDQGFSIAIFDKRDFMVPIENDGRTFAIAQGSQVYLQQLGIWENLKSHPTPIDHILLTDHKSSHRLHYEAQDLNQGPMGFMVKAEDIDVALKRVISGCLNIHTIATDGVKSLKTNPRQVQISLESGKTLKAPLAIAADGKHSKLRDLAGLSFKEIAYHQKAIVGTLTHEKPHHHIAFEHFTPFGPLALLPLPENNSAFVWSLEEAKADDIMRLDDHAFCEELEATFGDTLGEFTLQDTRQMYPLFLTTTKSLHDDRVVLVGDAAHAMHPVAGQGLNLGIRDVEDLAKCLGTAKQLGLDLGSSTLLEKYAKSRKWDQTSLLSSTHGLIRLFGNSSRALRTLRGVGMSFVNNIKPLKLFFMKRAMGIA